MLQWVSTMPRAAEQRLSWLAAAHLTYVMVLSQPLHEGCPGLVVVSQLTMAQVQVVSGSRDGHIDHASFLLKAQHVTLVNMFW